MKNSNSTLADWRKPKEQKLFDYVGTETWITKQFVCLVNTYILPPLSPPIQIFVERKTHREDWTGEKSVKARFPLKEHLINPFLRGEYTVDADFQQLVAKGKKTQQEVDTMIQLANEVQYAVLTKRLGPGEFFCEVFECFLTNFLLDSCSFILQPDCVSTPWRCSGAYITRHRAYSYSRG
jgi:hypothetical protein